MSNTGRITLCPFYRNHKKRTITCEDTLRFYPKEEVLSKHMDKYCDADWNECKYAKAYMDNLESKEYMGRMAAKELRKTVAHIGKLDKKINQLESENNAYSKVLVKKTADIKHKEQAIEELMQILKILELRLSYMAEVNGVEELDLKAFESWADTEHVKQIPILDGNRLSGIKFVPGGDK